MMHIPYQKTLLMTIMIFSLLLVNAVFGESAEKNKLKTILAFGDSLTAGYGIPPEKSFTAQLEDRLKQQGYTIRIANAGVSGDTTSGGLTRLEWVLQQKQAEGTGFVIVELGANDMLRAVDPAITRGNLKKILEILRKNKLPVLLAGIKASPNLGPEFVDSYKKMYQELAHEYDAVYYPFFMEGVIMEKNLIQADGLHPNAAGVAVIVDRILPYVKKLLDKK